MNEQALFWILGFVTCFALIKLPVYLIHLRDLYSFYKFGGDWASQIDRINESLKLQRQRQAITDKIKKRLINTSKLTVSEKLDIVERIQYLNCRNWQTMANEIFKEDDE